MNPARSVCASITLAIALAAPAGGDQHNHAHTPTSAAPAAHHDADALNLADIEIEPGRPIDLVLERFEVLDPLAPVIVAGTEGEFETNRPAVALYRGTIAGDPESSVFIASSARGVRGVITANSKAHFLTFESGAPRLTPADAIQAQKIPADLCAINAHADHFNAGYPEPIDHTRQTAANGKPSPVCRVADIAIDTDWEFTQIFRSAGAPDPAAAAEYAIVLMGAVSEIYRRDLNVRLNVTYLRVWGDDSDPYDDTDTLYNQFSSFWNANMPAVQRDAAHLLSGRLDQLFAGEASIASLCITDDAYAVSTKLTGAFPFPVQNQSPANWDPFVVAHELGHNFGSIHTHEYDPPIDACGSSNCTNAHQGTIMSYCHLCPGGVNNINLNFHPRVIDTILAYLDTAPCDLSASGNTASDDNAAAVQTLPTTIDVLLNDQTQSCGTVSIESFDPMSAGGARVELVPAGSFTRERLRYTPSITAATTDTFNYTITGGDSATVHINIEPLRAPDITGAVEPGVDAEYFVIASSLSQLPDFTTLNAYDAEIVPQLNYPASIAPFAGSGRSSFVGAVFTGFINIPAPGIYTIHLASDDGAALYLGDDILIDNDGVHTMIEKSQQVGLLAGMHRVRVEFFERTRAAGLIVSWEGPGIAKQVIPAANWFQSVPCPGDRNLDAAVDVDDLNIVLSQWGLTVPPFTGGDETGDGLVTVNDLNIVLSNWANTCP